MQTSQTLPTWPEVARNIAKMHVTAQAMLEQALINGDKAEVSASKKLVRDTKKLMDKYDITLA